MTLKNRGIRAGFREFSAILKKVVLSQKTPKNGNFIFLGGVPPPGGGYPGFFQDFWVFILDIRVKLEFDLIFCYTPCCWLGWFDRNGTYLLNFSCFFVKFYPCIQFVPY